MLENIIEQTDMGLLPRMKHATLLKLFLYGTALAFSFGCATATKQPSIFQTNPSLLTKQYTPDQITTIQQNFETNPAQYSQELGDLLLWQMHQKSPEFALEFAQTPELNDGIDQKEASAMMSIYNLIKDLDIPPDLFTKTLKPRVIHNYYEMARQ